MSRIIQNWKGLAVGFLLLLSIGLAVHQTVIYFQYFEWENAKTLGADPFEGEVQWDISEKDLLYLRGAPGAETWKDRWGRLVAAFPDDPAAYWWYCCHYGDYRKEDPLPANFRETVDGIAPENGWFQFLEAMAISKKVFESEKVALSDDEMKEWRGYNRWKSVEVVNEERLDEFLNLIKEAIAKPEFHTYEPEFRVARWQRLPAGPDDLMGQISRSFGLITFGYRGLTRDSLKPLRFRATEAIEKGDRKEFQEMFRLAEALIRKVSGNQSDIFSFRASQRQFYDLACFFKEGADQLGLVEMGEDLRKREKLLEPLFDREKWVESRRNPHPLDDLASAHLLDHNMGQCLEGSIELEDHRPMSRAIGSHLGWRKVLQIFWAGVGLLLILSCYRWLFARRIDDLAGQKLAGVKRWKVVLISSVLPLVLLLIFYRISANGALKPVPG